MRRWRATRTPALLKRPNGLLVIDTGQLRHRLHRDVDFPAFLAFLRLFDCRQILTNGILNIFESLFLGLSLRPAPWKAWAGDAEPFLATLDCDFLPHDSILPLANSMNSAATDGDALPDARNASRTLTEPGDHGGNE